MKGRAVPKVLFTFGRGDDLDRHAVKRLVVFLSRLGAWTAMDGRLCYLSTNGQGYVSTLADRIEEMQLTMGEDLLEYARSILAPGERVPSSVEYRWLVCRLAEALSDALRVADSRGQRIPVPQEEDGES